MPHALELARDPHLTLREVERVLVPEGRVVIAGFNPASLWGLRQRAGRMRSGLASSAAAFLPRAGEFIGYWRLRDWLRLASRSTAAASPLAPPSRRSAGSTAARGWTAGERWWPLFGAVYVIVAVKRVRGMRLVGMISSSAARRAQHRRPAPRRCLNSKPCSGCTRRCASPARPSAPTPAPPTMIEPVPPAVLIYADGACRGNPGPGGWGARLRMGDRERELHGGERLTTNTAWS